MHSWQKVIDVRFNNIFLAIVTCIRYRQQTAAALTNPAPAVAFPRAMLFICRRPFQLPNEVVEFEYIPAIATCLPMPRTPCCCEKTRAYMYFDCYGQCHQKQLFRSNLLDL